ncbi:FecCD family ABC transporter permease [Desulfolutivibrio sp.]|uniref:FecCD family ABC transporter permease n=1 Tax=Desulfolutivibrio sp. TaxID=2773296 RepID=UPI002F968FAD
MHFGEGRIPEAYLAHVGRKRLIVCLACVILAILFVASVSLGPVNVPPLDVLAAFLGKAASPRDQIIVLSIRLPQSLAAALAGMALSAAGAAMQSILRNPLGSPFTLGISHAAAFGAAFSVIILGSGLMTSSQEGAVTILNPYLTTGMAFAFCLVAALIVVGVSRLRGASPEVMVLTGVAMGALFTAGTMFLQYFADDRQLAAMVFWTFGDVARAKWNTLAFMAVVSLPVIGFFYRNRLNLNAIDAGDETARGLGVRVARLRLAGMLLASLLTATVVAFLGVIGFVGLVCPHLARWAVGDDHRFLLPLSCILGAVLLVASDTAARLVIAPSVLPVSVLTAFLGAPTFIALLLGRRKK